MGRAFTESRARICINEGITIVTTGRADPGEAAVRMMKQAGITVLSVIPTVEHARRMVAEGVDAIIASGNEAGGHVGHVATLPLVPQVVDAVEVPVLAAGGIGDSRGFLAAFAMGAAGVQIGTCLIPTPESNASDWYKQEILRLRETDTMITQGLTGATMRSLATPEVKAFEKARYDGTDKAGLQRLRQKLRRHAGYNEASAKADRRQGAAGQIAGMVRDVRPAGEIISTMIRDAVELSRDLVAVAAR